MCYKVMLSKSGKKVGSSTFNDYDEALSYALHQSEEKGNFALVLEFDIKLGKWKKRCSVYPND